MTDTLRIPPERVATEGGLPVDLDMDRKAHDVRYRTRVREALDDPGTPVPHHQVVEEAGALIARKRHARS